MNNKLLLNNFYPVSYRITVTRYGPQSVASARG